MVAKITQYNNGYRLPVITKKDNTKPKEHSQFVYSLIYHKTEILLCVVILIMMISMIFAAQCKTWEDFGGLEGSDKVGGILGLLIDYGGWIDTIVGSNKAGEYADLLSITASGTSFTIGGVESLEGLSGILTAVNDLFKVIGWGLALIFWGYSFAEMMMQSNGQLIVEQVIKKLMFLVVCFYVINNSLELCCEIVNAGTELTNAAVGSMSEVTTISDTVAAFKEEIFYACWSEEELLGIPIGGLLTNINAIGYLVQLLIPWIMTLICDIVIRVLCWSRAIEICILAAISPIMFMDLGSSRELTHSSTARALKNLMALAMQGALILISITICQAIMVGILDSESSFTTQVWQLALVAILQVATIGKTQSLAKQALGTA